MLWGMSSHPWLSRHLYFLYIGHGRALRPLRNDMQSFRLVLTALASHLGFIYRVAPRGKFRTEPPRKTGI
jgi:hypothetical protein